MDVRRCIEPRVSNQLLAPESVPEEDNETEYDNSSFGIISGKLTSLEPSQVPVRYDSRHYPLQVAAK